jgi:hypothetical protein
MSHNSMSTTAFKRRRNGGRDGARTRDLYRVMAGPQLEEM